MLHGVLDGPSLAGARLQDQQVAEVHVGRHNLQATPGGSVLDPVVLSTSINKEWTLMRLIRACVYGDKQLFGVGLT